MLDDPAALAGVDTGDFLGAVEGLPAQLADAVQRAGEVQGLPDPAGVSAIAVLGMGGSGISGELCRSILAPVARVPVATIRDYEVPAWVGPGTLVFAVSYSGETEETLSAFRQAADRGARIVAVTTGGTLAGEAAERGYAVARMPGGLMPRAALGYVGIPPLVICARLGLAGDLAADLREAVAAVTRRVDQCCRSVPAPDNLAKQIASRLAGTLPLIWGTEGIAGVAAYRWRCQMNENAKLFSAWATFPELNHNEVVGLYRSAAAGAPIGVVVLRHPGEHPRTAERIKATVGLISDSVAFVQEVWSAAVSPAARLLDLIVTGDLISTYLGIVRGVDPSPIEAIMLLKATLGS